MTFNYNASRNANSLFATNNRRLDEVRLGTQDYKNQEYMKLVMIFFFTETFLV